MDLFDHAERYPHAPGFTNQTTSRAAARKVAPKAGTQAARCLEYIRSNGEHGATPDECADALRMLVVSARPRCTQLKNDGLVIEAGERINQNGNASLVYVIAPPGTPTLHGKGRAVREREAVCAWLRSKGLDYAANEIAAGKHHRETEQ